MVLIIIEKWRDMKEDDIMSYRNCKEDRTHFMVEGSNGWGMFGMRMVKLLMTIEIRSKTPRKTWNKMEKFCLKYSEKLQKEALIYNTAR